MPSRELLSAAQRIGVDTDAAALDSFRTAALGLLHEQSESEAWRDAGADAAKALVGLALADDSLTLRDVLRPDPEADDVTWSVACYQIGDVTPSALRDFADPVDAVGNLAACPDRAHIAAELLASTSAGVRWVAMTRVNDRLTFKLPTPDTATDASREHPGALAGALRHWRDRLDGWEADRTGTRRRAAVADAGAGAVSTTPPASMVDARVADVPPAHDAQPAITSADHLAVLRLVIDALSNGPAGGQPGAAPTAPAAPTVAASVPAERPSAVDAARLDDFERRLAGIEHALHTIAHVLERLDEARTATATAPISPPPLDVEATTIEPSPRELTEQLASLIDMQRELRDDLRAELHTVADRVESAARRPTLATHPLVQSTKRSWRRWRDGEA